MKKFGLLFLTLLISVQGFSQLGLSWNWLGPDNWGGRCRAILHDRYNYENIYAGGANGGLFRSTDGGENWNVVDGYDLSSNNAFCRNNLAIASICQTLSGDIYVSTGCSYENFPGNGIYRSADYGITFTQITTSPSLVSFDINCVEEDPIDSTKIWIGSNKLYSYTPAGGLIQITTGTAVHSFDISPDAQQLIYSTSNEIYYSDNGGISFVSINPLLAGFPSTSVKIGTCISKTINGLGKYSVLVTVRNNSTDEVFMYHSRDGGVSWNETSGGTIPGSSSSGACIGVPGRPDDFVFGAENIYYFEVDAVLPDTGIWIQKSYWNLDYDSSGFVNTGINNFFWDLNDSTLSVANEIGFQRSLSKTLEGYAIKNKGLNFSSAYGVGFSGNGDILTAQLENGTKFNDFISTSDLSYDQHGKITSRDVEISQVDPLAMFKTEIYGNVLRSNDGGITYNGFYSPNVLVYGVPGSFTAEFGVYESNTRLFENPNDVNSLDSINVYNYTGSTLLAGMSYTLNFVHASYNLPGSVTFTPSVNIPDGSIAITVQDKVQTLFVSGLKGGSSSSPSVISPEQGVWMTRGSCEFFSLPHWDSIPGIGAEIGSGNYATCFDLSADGNYLFVGTNAGEVIRVNGLNTYYGGDGNYNLSGITITRIRSYSGIVSSVSSDQNNPNNLLVTLSGSAGTDRVQLISNALTATVGAAITVDIHTASLPPLRVLSGLIDIRDVTSNSIVIGTEWGIYTTSDQGANWFLESSGPFSTFGPGKTRISEIRQQRFPSGSSITNSGEIYIATEGRGVWSTSPIILSVDNNVMHKSDFSGMNIYPNPTKDNVSIELNSGFKKGKLYITTITGKIVYCEEIVDKDGNSITINLNGLDPGIYMVVFQTKDFSEAKKLVKN